MKEKILEATYELVAKQGYDKTSLSQIAQAVEIQKPSLYYYFKSKEEIFLATVKEFYGDLFVIDPEKVTSFQTKEEFKDFFMEYGTKHLHELNHNLDHQQFYCEVNLQSLRIPSLMEFFQNNDRKGQENLLFFLEQAQEKGFIPLDYELKTQMETIIALYIGLSEMILYRIESDYQKVWESYGALLFP